MMSDKPVTDRSLRDTMLLDHAGSTELPRSLAATASLYKAEGGGTRSEKAPAYHLNPGFAYRRVSVRFGLGAEIHGPENWKKSCETEELARKWCEEAFNHMQEHVHKMRAGLERADDHIGAIGWALEIFAYCENKFQKPWTQIGRPS